MPSIFLCFPVAGLLAVLSLLGCIERMEPAAPSTPGNSTVAQETAQTILRQPTGRRNATPRLSDPSHPYITGELPPAARQTREGYWMGAMIRPQDVNTLDELGIEVVLSAQEPDPETVVSLAAHGIEYVPIPMGDRFLHAETILAVANRHEPSRIYIHCQHGADRTGAIAAFLLVMNHGWLISDAFYAVLYRSQPDVEGLAGILEDRDLHDRRSVDDPTVGFYSLEAAGAGGGLKTHTSGGVRLVSSTIEAIEAMERLRSGRMRIPWDGRVD